MRPTVSERNPGWYTLSPEAFTRPTKLIWFNSASSGFDREADRASYPPVRREQEPDFWLGPLGSGLVGQLGRDEITEALVLVELGARDRLHFLTHGFLRVPQSRETVVSRRSGRRLHRDDQIETLGIVALSALENDDVVVEVSFDDDAQRIAIL